MFLPVGRPGDRENSYLKGENVLARIDFDKLLQI